MEYPGDDENLSIYEAVFRARVTAGALFGGVYRHAFTEQILSPANGGYITPESARTGTTTRGWIRLVSGAQIPDDSLVWAAFAGLVDGVPTYDAVGVVGSTTDLVRFCKVTSNPTAGIYPIMVQDHDASSDTWVDVVVASGKPANAQPLTVGTRYLGKKSEEDAPGGGPMYALEDDAPPGSWVIAPGSPVIISGGGSFTIATPFKVHDRWWLHYKNFSFAAATKHNFDPGTPGRVVLTITLDASSDVVLTGIVAYPDGGAGQVLVLTNLSEVYSLILDHESLLSDAANRFHLPKKMRMKIPPLGDLWIWWEPAKERWTVIGGWEGNGRFDNEIWLRHNDVSLSTGENVDVSQGDTPRSVLRVAQVGSAATLVSLEPILDGSMDDISGQLLWITNTHATQALTLAHEHEDGTAAYRFACPGNVNFVIPPRGGTWVIYDVIASRWRPGGVSPTVKRGILDTVMGAGGSATMSVWAFGADTTEDITVVDWLLSTGQTIPASTKVVAAYEPTSNGWYVIAAQCGTAAPPGGFTGTLPPEP